MNGEMTFNWKMKQSHKMTVTMFSPDNFTNSTKPQKTTTTTKPPNITISPPDASAPTNHPKFNLPNTARRTDTWEFHSEFPKKGRSNVPPLSKMTSAPSNLRQFTHGGTQNQATIQQFQKQPSPPSGYVGQVSPRQSAANRRNRVASHRTGSSPPQLRTQISTPSVVSLVSPINRLSLSRKSKTQTQRPFLHATKKLRSTSDLIHMASERKSDGNRKAFQPPPLKSRNSESSLPELLTVDKTSILPSVNDMVSGSPSTSPYNSCNDSDQEMMDVERRTGKMSIQNLLGPS